MAGDAFTINMIGVKKMGLKLEHSLTKMKQIVRLIKMDCTTCKDTGARTYSTTLMSLGLIGSATPTVGTQIPISL